MIDEVLNTILEDELKKLSLKENMTKYLVTKKKRGTVQALEECSLLEEQIKEQVKEYLRNWLVQELLSLNKNLRKSLINEIEIYTCIELNKLGFDKILQKTLFKK